MKGKSKGGFYKKPDGTWAIDTKITINGVRKHINRSGYDTLSAAKADFDIICGQKKEVKPITTNNLMFEDLMKDYLRMRSITINNSTLSVDESILHNYLKEFNNKKICNAFEKQNVKLWYNNLVDNETLSESRKDRIVGTMKRILKFAYNHEYIDANVYQSCDVQLYRIKYSKQPTHERVVWTSEEEKAFLEATKQDPIDHIMFKLFLISTCRLGEFLGLQVNCFNYQNRKIEIKQQVRNIKGKPQLTDKLKTNESYRTVMLPQSICDDLNNYITTLGLRDGNFIFHSVSGCSIPLGRTTFTRKLKNYCRKANVRVINPHASRHLQATKLASVCSTGDEIEAASRRMGHSPSMFMNTYAKHVNEKTENDLLQRLASI